MKQATNIIGAANRVAATWVCKDGRWYPSQAAADRGPKPTPHRDAQRRTAAARLSAHDLLDSIGKAR